MLFSTLLSKQSPEQIKKAMDLALTMGQEQLVSPRDIRHLTDISQNGHEYYYIDCDAIVIIQEIYEGKCYLCTIADQEVARITNHPFTSIKRLPGGLFAIENQDDIVAVIVDQEIILNSQYKITVYGVTNICSFVIYKKRGKFDVIIQNAELEEKKNTKGVYCYYSMDYCGQCIHAKSDGLEEFDKMLYEFIIPRMREFLRSLYEEGDQDTIDKIAQKMREAVDIVAIAITKTA